MDHGRPRIAWSLLGAAAVLLVALAAFRLAAGPSDYPAASLPSVELSITEFDAGQVAQGVQLEAEFPLRNTGGRRLIIRSAKPACCEHLADETAVLLSPGQETVLHVTVDTQKWFGRMEHLAEFTTNDPRCPRLTLCVRATIVSPD
jgi:hypothetical protein